MLSSRWVCWHASDVVTQPGLLASSPPGTVRVMARHFTGKEVQNNGDTCSFVHRTIADQLCIARPTHLMCESCREKKAIYVLNRTKSGKFDM